jgi:hypothetical protein
MRRPACCLPRSPQVDLKILYRKRFGTTRLSWANGDQGRYGISRTRPLGVGTRLVPLAMVVLLIWYCGFNSRRCDD